MQYLGKSFTLLLIVQFSDLTFMHCGNVLVLPGEYSHWYNMRNIVGELLNRIHSVAVLQESFQYLVFDVPLKAHEVHSLSEQLINIWMQYPRPNMVQIGLQIVDVLGKVHEMHQIMCDRVLRNDLLHTLRESHYDVFFSDPMMPCTDLMAQTLKILHVLLLQIPAPPSYVPAATLELKNMLLYIVHTTIFRLNMKFTFDTIYTEIWENSLFFSPSELDSQL
uniref:Uncharacterized protein n=1 Tax=Cyprinus carpio TaxID=7962 RepID=A0A8C2IK24_CYPCA